MELVILPPAAPSRTCHPTNQEEESDNNKQTDRRVRHTTTQTASTTSASPCLSRLSHAVRAPPHPPPRPGRFKESTADPGRTGMSLSTSHRWMLCI